MISDKVTVQLLDFRQGFRGQVAGRRDAIFCVSTSFVFFAFFCGYLAHDLDTAIALKNVLGKGMRLRERRLGGEGWRGNRTLQPPHVSRRRLDIRDREAQGAVGGTVNHPERAVGRDGEAAGAT